MKITQMGRIHQILVLRSLSMRIRRLDVGVSYSESLKNRKSVGWTSKTWNSTFQPYSYSQSKKFKNEGFFSF